MALIAKNKGGEDFAPIPSGLHHAICYGVVDLGTQPSFNTKFPARRKVLFIFEIPGQRIEIEKDGHKQNLPRAISEKYTLSLASKGNLRPLLESWRGRQFTDDELAGFDVMNVCGANALLNITHNTKDGRTFANIAGVNPLMAGTKKLISENPPLKFSMDDFPVDITFPERMPEWVKLLITQSDEYIARQQRKSTGAQQQGKEMEPIEDDVPF